MFRYLTSFLLLFILVSPVHAGNAKLNQILELSGLNEQLDMIPGMITSTVAQGDQRAPEEVVDKAEAIFRRAFSSERLRRQVVDELSGQFSDAELNGLLTWYESPLAKKITAAEHAAASVDAAELQMVVGALGENQQLVELAVEVERLTGITDLMMRFQEQAALSLYTTVAAIMQPGQPLNYDQMQAGIRQQMGGARSQTYNYMLAMMMYSWKDISVEELQQYRTFLRTDAASRFMRLASKGTLDAMNLAFSDGVAELMQSLKKND